MICNGWCPRFWLRRSVLDSQAFCVTLGTVGQHCQKQPLILGAWPWPCLLKAAENLHPQMESVGVQTIYTSWGSGPSLPVELQLNYTSWRSAQWLPLAFNGILYPQTPISPLKIPNNDPPSPWMDTMIVRVPTSENEQLDRHKHVEGDAFGKQNSQAQHSHWQHVHFFHVWLCGEKKEGGTFLDQMVLYQQKVGNTSIKIIWKKERKKERLCTDR